MKPDQLEENFRNKVKIWSKKIKVIPCEVRVERMIKKWGYCQSNGIVGFSSELLFLDGELQDFVIIHELLHLKISNHGKLFQSLLSAYLPNWKYLKQKLSMP